mmetsp:Transcript_30293/g.82879  ORF Transcript_30293/g.82879 Transcript_30293/m.82879 type:complete len:272 (-) Transcript_30293:1952-2767(-)
MAANACSTAARPASASSALTHAASARLASAASSALSLSASDMTIASSPFAASRSLSLSFNSCFIALSRASACAAFNSAFNVRASDSATRCSTNASACDARRSAASSLACILRSIAAASARAFAAFASSRSLCSFIGSGVARSSLSVSSDECQGPPCMRVSAAAASSSFTTSRSLPPLAFAPPLALSAAAEPSSVGGAVRKSLGQVYAAGTPATTAVLPGLPVPRPPSTFAGAARLTSTPRNIRRFTAATSSTRLEIRIAEGADKPSARADM